MTALTMEILNMSTRGRIALDEGKKPFDLWTVQDMKYQVIRIKLNNKPCPAVRFDSLDEIPKEILTKKLLYRCEWHHVNFLPYWFYKIDERAVKELTMDDIREMQHEAQQHQEILNKPRLARFAIRKWKVSQSGHEFCDTHQVYGVLYNNTAYFDNGESMRIIKDKCEISKLYPKVPKTRRTQYDLIRRKMRAYDIFC